jgi:hypothetical protein
LGIALGLLLVDRFAGDLRVGEDNFSDNFSELFSLEVVFVLPFALVRVDVLEDLPDSAVAFRLRRLWTFLISSTNSAFFNPCHPGTP